MTTSWVEVVVTGEGTTMLDGEPVGGLEGFASAIERIALGSLVAGFFLLAGASAMFWSKRRVSSGGMS